jgi:hypothetical protein
MRMQYSDAYTGLEDDILAIRHMGACHEANVYTYTTAEDWREARPAAPARPCARRTDCARGKGGGIGVGGPRSRPRPASRPVHAPCTMGDPMGVSASASDRGERGAEPGGVLLLQYRTSFGRATTTTT